MGTVRRMSRYTLVLVVLTIILVSTDWVKAKTLLVETLPEPEPAPQPEPEKKCSGCKSKFRYTNEGDYGLCPGHHTCYSDYNDYNDDYITCPWLGHPTCFGYMEPI